MIKLGSSNPPSYIKLLRKLVGSDRRLMEDDIRTAMRNSTVQTQAQCKDEVCEIVLLVLHEHC
jgi:hypothetical protein